MGYSPVPTVASGDLWTASDHNTYIRDNFAAGVPDIFAAAGDLVYGSAANVAARLAIGANGYYLRSNGNAPYWSTITFPTEIPAQSGNSGKFLTTNGAAVSWGWPIPVISLAEKTSAYNISSTVYLEVLSGTITMPSAGKLVAIAAGQYKSNTSGDIAMVKLQIDGTDDPNVAEQAKTDAWYTFSLMYMKSVSAGDRSAKIYLKNSTSGEVGIKWCHIFLLGFPGA